MATLSLDVRAANRAILANFRGQEAWVRSAVQRLNRRRGPAHRERVYAATPKVTGRMRRLLRFRFTPNDYGYELGWDPADFEAEGEYPYFRVVLYGNERGTVVGNDFFSPIAEREAVEYRQELRTLLATGGPMGRGARGRRR